MTELRPPPKNALLHSSVSFKALPPGALHQSPPALPDRRAEALILNGTSRVLRGRRPPAMEHLGTQPAPQHAHAQIISYAYKTLVLGSQLYRYRNQTQNDEVVAQSHQLIRSQSGMGTQVCQTLKALCSFVHTASHSFSHFLLYSFVMYIYFSLTGC